MFKRTTYLLAVIAFFILINFTAIERMGALPTGNFADLTAEYSWADEDIKKFVEKGIISGVEKDMFFPGSLITKEQVATMISKAFDLTKDQKVQTFVDVEPQRWSFDFIESTKDIIVRSGDIEINEYAPERPMTRAEIAASCIRALGLKESDLQDKDMLPVSFIDYEKIPFSIADDVALATEQGIVKGSDGYLRPNDYVTRAEATVMICRAQGLIKNLKKNNDSLTLIIDDAHISAKEAKAWAEKRGAHQRFIDAANLYWEYGKKTGLNPEVMYGQAAKETNFGKYTGNVLPSQNNWAGIKIRSPQGDRAEDHETFETVEEGVRAHFNHMCAYVGLAPVGKPHERYELVVTCAWAGSVRYAEELSGKWAPADDYGSSLVENYVKEMRNIKEL